MNPELKALIAMGAVLVALIAIPIGCSSTFNVITSPGTGQKVGQITRINSEGLIFKTYEAELVRGGFSNGSGVVGAPFHFTIPTRELFIQAQVYMEHQTEVKITYEGKFISLAANGCGIYLTSIAPAAEGK